MGNIDTYVTLQVIKVVAKKRVGESNFITAIRETLKKRYGDKVVGKLALVFYQ